MDPFHGKGRGIRAALEKAFDYRGDLTITLKSGEKIEGYLYDRKLGEIAR